MKFFSTAASVFISATSIVEVCRSSSTSKGMLADIDEGGQLARAAGTPPKGFQIHEHRCPFKARQTAIQSLNSLSSRMRWFRLQMVSTLYWW
ncbi:hypothetical protein BDZ89DRAFT_170020 [Hymenopellis radicata]|nr:hypothetical protein BDZ89DRAFT_170020 [Hymenopellis radicata]